METFMAKKKRHGPATQSQLGAILVKGAHHVRSLNLCIMVHVVQSTWRGQSMPHATSNERPDNKGHNEQAELVVNADEGENQLHTTDLDCDSIKLM